MYEYEDILCEFDEWLDANHSGFEDIPASEALITLKPSRYEQLLSNYIDANFTKYKDDLYVRLL